MKTTNFARVSVNASLMALSKEEFITKCENDIMEVGTISPNMSIETLSQKVTAMNRIVSDICDYAKCNGESPEYTSLVRLCNTEIIPEILNSVACNILELSGMTVKNSKEININFPQIGFFTMPKKWFHGNIMQFIQVPQEFVNKLHLNGLKARLIEVSDTVIMSKSNEVLTRISTYDGKTISLYQLSYRNFVFDRSFENTFNCPVLCSVDRYPKDRNCIFIQVLPE